MEGCKRATCSLHTHPHFFLLHSYICSFSLTSPLSSPSPHCSCTEQLVSNELCSLQSTIMYSALMPDYTVEHVKRSAESLRTTSSRPTSVATLEKYQAAKCFSHVSSIGLGQTHVCICTHEQTESAFIISGPLEMMLF